MVPFALVGKFKAACQEYGTAAGCDALKAEAGLRQELGPDACLRCPRGKGGQTYLPGLVDARIREGLEQGPCADAAYSERRGEGHG